MGFEQLIYQIMEPAVFMAVVRIPDGEGGYFSTYQEGGQFDAAIELNAPKSVLVVGQVPVITGPYTVTVKTNVVLSEGDIIKRLSDGAYFKVNSGTVDRLPPKTARTQIVSVEAERIPRLPSLDAGGRQ